MSKDNPLVSWEILAVSAMRVAGADNISGEESIDYLGRNSGRSG